MTAACSWWSRRCGVLIVVVVGVDGVAEQVGVGVHGCGGGIGRIRRRGAVCGLVLVEITVTVVVRIADIAHAVPVQILLAGVRRRGAIVVAVGDDASRARSIAGDTTQVAIAGDAIPVRVVRPRHKLVSPHVGHRYEVPITVPRP